MFTPTLRCECAQPASDRLMRKWCIIRWKFLFTNNMHVQGSGLCLLGGVNHAQCRTNKPLSIGDCYQADDVVPITGQCLMC